MSKQSKGVGQELYFYPNKQDANRRITVAGAVVNNQLQVGHSIQRPGELFNRHIGRGVALGRAVSRPTAIYNTRDLNLSPERTLSDAFIEIARQYRANHGI